jgi:hypothetical protein
MPHALTINPQAQTAFMCLLFTFEIIAQIFQVLISALDVRSSELCETIAWSTGEVDTWIMLGDLCLFLLP